MINTKNFVDKIQKNLKEYSKIEKKFLIEKSEKIYKQAAVIILITKEEGTILFIKRSTSLNLHKGEIGFPGGKFENEDENLLQTALRELYEEIRLHKSQVEIIGTLPKIITTTDFIVTPFIGLISKFSLHFSDSDEVEAIINVPIDVLLNKENYKELAFGKKSIHLYFYQKHVIWGATASIVTDLISRIH